MKIENKIKRERKKQRKKTLKIAGVVIIAFSLLGFIYVGFTLASPQFYVDNICPVTGNNYLFFCNGEDNLQTCMATKMAFCRAHSNATDICANVSIRDIWVGGYSAYQIEHGNTSVEGFERHQFDYLIANKYGVTTGSIPIAYNCDKKRMESWNVS